MDGGGVLRNKAAVSTTHVFSLTGYVKLNTALGTSKVAGGAAAPPASCKSSAGLHCFCSRNERGAFDTPPLLRQQKRNAQNKNGKIDISALTKASLLDSMSFIVFINLNTIQGGLS